MEAVSSQGARMAGMRRHTAIQSCGTAMAPWVIPLPALLFAILHMHTHTHSKVFQGGHWCERVWECED